ncbi:tyrosine-protein phosphatase [Lactobacillus sp. ESL0791]|uniref:tyrosine-protein phosphatase n=1 Tax=Lactobacillus sp. ESL0791 TaxID=2983234 RepID=UPI0023F6B679|nr:tyrosine-protein phosphatase [Lactobacillus sp. ESL0791]MDF7639739.1 tyrosine-protein phosphatase [Lactobacillus sp. ESL0791]
MSDPVILPVKSVRNPRDLGGYVGFQGHKIKSGRLLRTGKISSISKSDRQFLLDYGLKKVIDLRSPNECRKDPDQEIAGVSYYSLPIVLDSSVKGNVDTEAAFAEYRRNQYVAISKMCERYGIYVQREKVQNNFRQIFKLLLETKEGAVLYHCSEGKDRTGLVTALILYVLGVDLETIRQDYLYSNYMLNDYRAKRDAAFKARGENMCFRANMRILGSVADAFLDTTLITIEKRFGGLDRYVENQLGITAGMKNTLRELYLEK